MKLTTILFDLDGTLLPMDQEQFTKAYFSTLAEKMSVHGYEREQLVSAIWSGTKEMIKNTGKETNETVFWKKFCQIFGEQALSDEPKFADFYKTDFDAVQAYCGYNARSAEVIRLTKQKGYRIVLATNPLFPAIATEKRIRWAGLDPNDFTFISTYENSHYSKPDLNYYREILERLDLSAEECLMIGNDVDEDMAAADLGMHVFLLTDCLINKSVSDISSYPHGTMEQLLGYLASDLSDPVKP